MNVLLYYYYNKINNTNEYYDTHKLFCDNLNLKGRIIISSEGLNGTISGSFEDCNKYMNFVKDDKRFQDIEFKIDECNEHLFHKMSIKIKPFLIKLGIDNLDPNIDTGIHLSSDENPRKITGSLSILTIISILLLLPILIILYSYLFR